MDSPNRTIEIEKWSDPSWNQQWWWCNSEGDIFFRSSQTGFLKITSTIIRSKSNTCEIDWCAPNKAATV